MDMNRIVIVMTLVASCVAALATDRVPRPNLVANGGFEDPAITDGGYQGSEYGLWYTDEVYLLKDARYRLSGWVKTEGVASAAIMFAPSGNVNFGVTPEWTYFERVFDATVTARDRLHLAGYGEGQAYFDDISIQMISGPSVGGAGAIATDGAPLTEIVLPDGSNMTEIYLAMEARRVLKEMTGVDLPIVKLSAVVPDANRRIYIGQAADTTPYASDLATVGDEGIVLDITPLAIVCLGNTARGVYYAVQEFFYILGCRWYTPWDGGEAIPHATTLSLPTQKIVHQPSFALRGTKVVHAYYYPPDMTTSYWMNGWDWTDWAARNRMNGLTPGGTKFISYGEIRGYDAQDLCGHTLHYILGVGGRTVEKYPLYYPLVDGVRTAVTPWAANARPSNICVSNEDVINYFADFANEHFDRYPYAERLMICQMDVGAWCECDHCLALDPPGLIDWSEKAGEACILYGLTDRWMWFINRVAEKVETKHPDKFIGTFAYADTVRPPVNASNNPRGNVMIEQTLSFTVNYPVPCGPWESARCWKHSLDDPACRYSRNGLDMLNLWSGLAPIALYSYYRCYNQGYLPDSYAHAEADFYRAMHARGVRHVSDEWSTDVLAAPLLLNLRMRLLWDLDTDVDRYIDDFCTKVYGPAAAPVKQYFQTSERVTSTAAGSHVVYNEILLTLAKCTELESHLAAAEAAAGSDTILLGRIARLRIAVYYARILLNDPNAQAVKTAANALIQTYNIQIQHGMYVF